MTSEIKNLKEKIEKATEENDSTKINSLYNKLIFFLPQDFEIFNKWFSYLIFYYEDYIDSEPDIEIVFENAISKCKIAQKKCEAIFLSDLLFFEYKLVDILTEFNPDYFVKYNIQYQLSLLNQIISLNPLKVDAYEKRAFIYQAIGENDKMISDFDKIQEIEKDIDEFKLLNISIGNQIAFNDEDAIKTYEKILKKTDKDAFKKICYENLILLYERLGDKTQKDYYQNLLDNL